MSHAPKVLIKLNPIGLAQILHSNLTGPRAKPKDEEHNMTTGKFNFNALAIAAAVAISVPTAGALARPANILELDRGSYGLSDHDAVTGGSNMGALLLSEGNTITTTNSLTGPFTGYDAVWVSYSSGSALSGSEISNLQSFVSGGGKLVLIGDSTAGGAAVAAWDAALAAVVGGGIGSTVGAAAFVTPTMTGTLTDSLASGSPNGVRFKGFSTVDPILGSPELLFDIAVAGYYTVGAGHALMILDSDWMSNSTSAGIPARVGNTLFAHDISVWLDPPDALVAAAEVAEPGSLAALGFGLLAFTRLRRRQG